MKEIVIKEFISSLNNLHNLHKDFTILELSEFSTLNSKYAKSLYCFLKQYRTQGVAPLQPMPMSKFRRVMGISENYNYYEIERQILNSAIKKLSELTLFNQVSFQNLQCLKFDKNIEKINNEVIIQESSETKKRRRRVKFIQFTFVAQEMKEEITNISTNTISKKQEQSELLQFAENLNDKFKYKNCIFNNEKHKIINFSADLQNQEILVFFENGSVIPMSRLKNQNILVSFENGSVIPMSKIIV